MIAMLSRWSLLVLVAACGESPASELPAEFVIETEIVSVEAVGVPEANCNPHEAIAGGPDWSAFFRVVDGTPRFFPSGATDDQAICLAADRSDCCTPLARTGDGWRTTCPGDRLLVTGSRVFVFDFADDWSGVGVSTFTGSAMGSCTSTFAWSTLILD